MGTDSSYEMGVDAIIICNEDEGRHAHCVEGVCADSTDVKGVDDGNEREGRATSHIIGDENGGCRAHCVEDVRGDCSDEMGVDDDAESEVGETSYVID